jgi:hypothetical protein
MAHQNEISCTLPNDCYKWIPQYDGSPTDLPYFLTTCEELLQQFCAQNIKEHINNHWMLVKIIMTKLSGPARVAVVNASCNSVADILSCLKKNFAERRTTSDLLSDIFHMRCSPRQHPIDFLNELECKRITIITKYRIDGESGKSLSSLIEQLDEMLIRALCYGVHPTLGSQLKTLSIKTLEEARQKLLDDCDITIAQLYKNNSVSDKSLTHPKPFFQPQNFQPKFNQNTNFQNANFQRFHQPSPFNQTNPQRFNPPQHFNPQRFNQTQNFNQVNPRMFPHHFNQVHKNHPDNDVSMRTVNSFRRPKPLTTDEKLAKLRSPYELTTVETQNQELETVKNKLESLTVGMEKIMSFLEISPPQTKDPPLN